MHGNRKTYTSKQYVKKIDEYFHAPIGEIYIKNDNSRVGKVMEYNERFKVITMMDSYGDVFNVTLTSFKHFWHRRASQNLRLRWKDADKLSGYRVGNEVMLIESLRRKPDGIEYMKTFSDTFSDFMLTLPPDVFSLGVVPSKKCYSLKLYGRPIVDFYPRVQTHSFKMYMSQQLFDLCKWSRALGLVKSDVSFKQNEVLPIVFAVKEDKLNILLDDLHAPIVQVYSEVQEKIEEAQKILLEKQAIEDEKEHQKKLAKRRAYYRRTHKKKGKKKK